MREYGRIRVSENLCSRIFYDSEYRSLLQVFTGYQLLKQTDTVTKY